jgi:hypothetical protein
MNPSAPRRGLAKKIALAFAGVFLTCGFMTTGAALWFWQTGGKAIITGSLGATTFFFITGAIVLYEMSRPQQPLPPPDEQS